MRRINSITTMTKLTTLNNNNKIEESTLLTRGMLTCSQLLKTLLLSMVLLMEVGIPEPQ
jgi:hypothetical protein